MLRYQIFHINENSSFYFLFIYRAIIRIQSNFSSKDVMSVKIFGRNV